MGDIKRKRKKYSRPKKLYDKKRIEDENVLVQKYGLKNKKEIWKAKSAIAKIRGRAKSLISKSEEEKKKFLEKLYNMGFKTKKIADVLALTEENWLERRLQTFVFKKTLAKTPKQARQFIVHKQILVGENIINLPSFFVTTDLEDKLSVKQRKIKLNKTSEQNGKE